MIYGIMSTAALYHISHIAVAKAIGAEKHVGILTKHLDEIERSVGMRE